MAWTKLGLVIKPTGDWWNKTHCMLPTPEHLGGSIYRIYYGGRNDKNQSHVGYADIDLDNPDCVEYCKEPVLSPGNLGRFDDNGVLPSCVVGNVLHYIGFKPGGTTRMQLISGKAVKFGDGFVPICKTGESYIGISTAPYECDGRVYYVHGIEWKDPDTPSYDIRVWNNDIAIGLRQGEIALARPYVMKENDAYKMFFAAKGDKYRPQYAESLDGYNWCRMPYEFPEEFMEYEIVINHGGREFMFYNKDYGIDGVYLAVR